VPVVAVCALHHFNRPGKTCANFMFVIFQILGQELSSSFVPLMLGKSFFSCTLRSYPSAVGIVLSG
jgi:hypothetical protein